MMALLAAPGINVDQILMSESDVGSEVVYVTL